MSDVPVDNTAPEAVATSGTNEQIKPDTVEATVPADKDVTMTESESKVVEDAPAKVEEKAEKDGEAAPPKEELKKEEKPYVKRENHSKYDPTILPEDDDPKKICAQVEFYFGDSNLPKDQNLWRLTDGTENKPVPIKTLHTFGRMRRFQPYSAVVAALRKSVFLDVVGLEGLEGVQRKLPYDPSFGKESKVEARSIYAKGFGEEEPSTQFDIETFFIPFGPTRSVRLRRSVQDKLFKGSVFVEFQDEETAQKFMEMTDKPKWKGEDLKYMTKAAYVEMKNQDILDGKIEPQLQTRKPVALGERGRGGNRGGRGRGDFKDRRGNKNGDRSGGRDNEDRDPNDWKKRREDDRANGFKNDRRGGRGNRRGGRGGRDGKDNRNDRNRERDGEKTNNEDKAEAKSESNAEVKAEQQSSPNGKKRSREEDGTSAEAPTSKKVDVKAEQQSSPNGKKRSREEDGAPAEAPAPKKVNVKPEAS